MTTITLSRSLTAADVKHNLRDIQDNVVTPILMRYGRHIFVKFNDGAKARAWLRNMVKRVNARCEEHGTRFTVNIGYHHVHHLSSGVPFYRLPEVLRTYPELRNIGRLTLWQSLVCVRLTLWEEETRRLLSFREARAAYAASRLLKPA
jgi:fatty acid desaturase